MILSIRSSIVNALKYNTLRHGRKFASGVKFIEDKTAAEEAVYFRKESENLLKNLLANHPEYDPKYDLSVLEKTSGALARDVNLVCEKYGWSGATLPFYKDIVKVFEMHGWKKDNSKN